jgi:abortive infection bacteriophage resistance protein
MDLKQPLPYDKQIQKLLEHGLIINNHAFAEEILSQVNYYRLTGYGVQFRKKPNVSDFLPGTDIETLYSIYLFDQEMRGLLLTYLDIIEALFRTRISYYASLNLCNAPPYNQHYDPSNYFNKSTFNSIMTALEREHNYNCDTLIIKHHDQNYSGQMPLWVWVNIMSFSNLSKYYTCLPYNIQKQIAQSVESHHAALKNHLHALSVVRNKCAHGGRLYNVKFNPPVKLERSFLKKNSAIKNYSLFAVIYTITKYLPNHREKVLFKEQLLQLLKKYQDSVDKSLIGFQDNWYDLLKIQTK